MLLNKMVLLLLTWATLFNIAQAQWEQNPLNYKTYINKGIYNFEVKYPEKIFTQQYSPSGSVSFVSQDRETILKVWEKKCLPGNNWEQEYKYVLNRFNDAQITYKVFKDSFFVISGFQGDKIFYWKELVVNNSTGFFLGFEMYFPKEKKTQWDPILKTCLNSFKHINNSKSTTTEDHPEFFFEDDKLAKLADKEWYEKVKPFGYGFLRLGDQEIAALANRFNWDEKQKDFFKKFLKNDYRTQDIKPSFGNTYNAALYVSQNGETKGERDAALKELTDYEERAAAPQNESFQKELKYIKKLREILGSDDLEFWEWFKEDRIIYAPMTYGASADENFKELESSDQVQNYKKYKSQTFKSQETLEKYISLWEKSIKDRILLAESTDPRQWKDSISNPDKLSGLTQELNGFTHNMYLLENKSKSKF